MHCGFKMEEHNNLTLPPRLTFVLTQTFRPPLPQFLQGGGVKIAKLGIFLAFKALQFRNEATYLNSKPAYYLLLNLI